MNSVITIISDFGLGSPYAASVVGKSLSLMPNARLIEISHQVKAFDLVQAAFLIRSTYLNFPVGTCHIIAVDTSLSLYKRLIWVTHKGHHFIAADNGVFALLFDEPIEEIYVVEDLYTSSFDLFPEKNLMLPLVAKFYEEGTVNGFAKPGSLGKELKSLGVTFSEDSIGGNVIYVDAYQNAITNIHKSDFEKAANGRAFKLHYWGKHYVDSISNDFAEKGAGDDLLLFNENGYLIIAMNRGQGAQLLGLKPGSNIVMYFEE